MTPEQGIKLLQDRFKSVMTRLPVLVGNIAVNFSLDNFRRQAFLGNLLEPWPARRRGWKKDRRPNRNILINTGRLRRSIRVVRITPSTVVIGSDVKYARAHNEGMRVGMIQTVKGYVRKNGSTVKPHTRRIDQNIPRRRFMGNSPYLNAAIRRTVSAEFMKAIK
jgi:phage gpG-like protein